MKNKVKLKKLLMKIIIFSIIFISLSSLINIYQYQEYTRNFNIKLNNIVNTIKEKYPNVSNNDIMDIVNSTNDNGDIFSRYNININKDSIIIENNKSFYRNIIFNNMFLLLIIIIISFIFIKYNNHKDQEINNITRLIEEINRKNYSLDIDDISEDELSLLKNEIYKTTILLKEEAINSTKDKMELKESLVDISHQLKTPLTSINIILDNLIQDSNMDKNIRQDFLLDIKREINNINILVQDLLRLSKLETNTVVFKNESVNINEIINDSINKLSILCDLKAININNHNLDNISIKVDKTWQIEALCNILKNCIEHTTKDIDIFTYNRNTYIEIIIKDYGEGISSKDLPHIFERFYKGEKALNDSVGIGLALSKSIIEKSNGKIMVDSNRNIGSIFTIRYYK